MQEAAFTRAQERIKDLELEKKLLQLRLIDYQKSLNSSQNLRNNRNQDQSITETYQ